MNEVKIDKATEKEEQKLKKFGVIAIIAAILAIVGLAILLFGASGGFDKASKQALNYSEQAIKIADQYLDFDITLDELEEKFETLYVAYDEYYCTLEDPSDEEYYIHREFLSMSIAISGAYRDGGYNDILEARNDLAEESGEKLR